MILVDQKQEYLDRSLDIIRTSLKRVVKKKFENDQEKGEKFFADVQSRIKTNVDVNDAVKSTDLVIEAIVENLEIKQKLFQQIDRIAPKLVALLHSFSFNQILDIRFSRVIHHHYRLRKLREMLNDRTDSVVYISSIQCNEQTNN